jgi:hypothetical protein
MVLQRRCPLIQRIRDALLAVFLIFGLCNIRTPLTSDMSIFIVLIYSFDSTNFGINEDTVDNIRNKSVMTIDGWLVSRFTRALTTGNHTAEHEHMARRCTLDASN